MKVVERFISINGEGTHAGELAVFIRFKGCNLSCSYCDTDWANEADCPYEEMTPAEVADYIRDTGVANVTLTGGEPLLQEDVHELLTLLCSKSGLLGVPPELSGSVAMENVSKDTDIFDTPTDVSGVSRETILPKTRVEIETNGSVDISPFCGDNRPVFTLDYKLPSSGCEGGMITGNFDHLHPEDTVKFVCGSRADLLRAKEIIEEHGLIGRCNIYLSPVFGKIEPADIVEFMAVHKLNGVRLQLQLHKVIWHPEARGV